MKNKYKIIDEDTNEEIVVTEDDETISNEEVVTNEETTKVGESDEPLNSKEISELRSLLSIADKLKALVDSSTLDEKTCTEDEESEIEEPSKVGDSKKGFGSIEKHVKQVDDEVIDDISSAWSKRYSK